MLKTHIACYRERVSNFSYRITASHIIHTLWLFPKTIADEDLIFTNFVEEDLIFSNIVSEDNILHSFVHMKHISYSSEDLISKLAWKFIGLCSDERR